MYSSNQSSKKSCLTCGEWFSPFKKSSFCAKCLHKQLTERKGNLRRRYLEQI